MPSANQLAIDTNPADPNYNQLTLAFGQLGAPTTLSLTPAYATFTLSLDPATCGSGAAAVVTVVQQTANTFAVAGNAAGICKATITSPSAVGTQLWFSVNLTGFSIQ